MLDRYYQTIRSHIKLILLCAIVALAGAAVYVKVAPKKYTATAQLVVNPATSTDTVLFSLPVLHSSGDPTQDVLTASSLFHIPAIAQATITALHLHMTPNQLLSQVTIVPLDESNILSVSTTSSDPAQAQRIANTFASEVVAVRSASLHKAIAAIIPGLKTTVAQEPVAEQSAAGGLGDQLTQLEQMQTTPDPTVSVSSTASLPTSPTSPKTKLSLVAGLLAGLLVGVGAAFGLDALDPRVRREGQLTEQFPGTAILARIPRRAGRPRPGPLTPIDLPVDALEQYRRLRATLTTRDSGNGQAYLITSTASAEGKSTSAINLAAVLAQGGAEVILIDADLRRPTINNALGITDFYGIEEVMDGRVELSDALTEVRLGPTGFHLLAAHGHSVESANRLTPADASELIDAARHLADIVVIDSPPLTAVVDALSFAQVVDQVVVVVRMEHTKLSRLHEAWELLVRHGSTLGGFVLIGTRRQRELGYGYTVPAESAGWQRARSARQDQSVETGSDLSLDKTSDQPSRRATRTNARAATVGTPPRTRPPGDSRSGADRDPPTNGKPDAPGTEPGSSRSGRRARGS